MCELRPVGQKILHADFNFVKKLLSVNEFMGDIQIRNAMCLFGVCEHVYV